MLLHILLHSKIPNRRYLVKLTFHEDPNNTVMSNIWIPLCLLLCFCGSPCSAARPGSCSTSCLRSAAENSEKYRCSCSSSCALYGDCCFDAPFRNASFVNHKTTMACLPLSRIGGILAINSCPESWKGSAESCIDNLGHLPPVYSLETGTTYSNIYCATCHDDVNITEWKIEMICCGSTAKPRSEDVKYVAQPDRLLRVSFNNVLPRSSTVCRCSMKLLESRERFLSKTEVRSCERNEISKCSMTWKDKDVSEMCKSYLDPIYLSDKTYRNIHCAICNYENERGTDCVPYIMNIMHENKMTREEMILYCQQRGLSTCLHFLSWTKGRRYAFHKLVAIDSRDCLPPPGRRCCEGKWYDFRHKRCRDQAPKH